MRSRAVIVSHGQPSDPDVGEREIREVAALVGAHLSEWEVRGATLAGEGTFESAIGAGGSGCVVYPLFMSDGWFTQTIIPRRLAAVATAGEHSGAVQVLPPLGLDDALVGLSAEAVRRQAQADQWDVADVALVVVGHGSTRSDRPAQITRTFTEALVAELGGVREVRCGFVEQPPVLAEVLADCDDRSLCLPFFAARRGHVLSDIPEAATAATFTGRILDPIGIHPGVPALIASRIAASIVPTAHRPGTANPGQSNDRVAAVLTAIDEINAQDPNSCAGKPRALVQGQQAMAWALELNPTASSAVRIATRAHHLRRWEMPRSDFPDGRAGYLKWRRAAKAKHRLFVEGILSAHDWPADEIDRVGTLIERMKLGRDAETQLVEDAACLVFLETQFDDMVEQLGHDHMVRVVTKTVKKMSDDAIAAVGTMTFSPATEAVLEAAVSPAADEPGQTERLGGKPRVC